jgi:tol-pal system protein YbgF
MLLLAGLSCGLITPLWTASAADQTPSMEQRLERLERILRNQNMTDIILQLQQLQQEVRQLRGELEVQGHTLDALSKRQRDLYLDIDQRLSTLQTTSTGREPDAEPVAPGGEPLAPSGVPQAVSSSVDEPPRVAVTPPDPEEEEEVYQAAFNLLQQGRYQESIQAFRAFLDIYPGGSYEDNAQYWLGEASYVGRDYDTALSEFTKVIDRYPTSPKVAGALLKSGYIYYEKKDWQKARELFAGVKTNYPGTAEARLADKRLQLMDKQGH